MPPRVTGAAFAALAMPKSVSFTRPVGHEQDVAGLHVAVHEAALVRGLQGLPGLLEDVQRAIRRLSRLRLARMAASGSPSTSSITRYAVSLRAVRTASASP